MKKGINLITRQKKYLRYEKIFSIVRIAFFLLIGVFFLLAGAAVYFISQKNSRLDRLLSEKKRLLEYLAANQQVEAEFVYLQNKQSQLSEILKDDVNFLPYYDLLTDSLHQASPEPILDTIIIAKDRTVNFILRFDNPDSITSFLKFAESDEFLRNFSQLVISQFGLEQKKGSKNYQLLLVGKLEEINEIKK